MHCIALLVASLLPALTLAFPSSHNAFYRMHHPRPSLLLSVPDGEDNPTTDTDETHISELDDLRPPSISLTRNSILFGDNPPTQQNNVPLRIWRGTKSVLPPIVTGVWNDEEGGGDTKPVEHLYNLVFVRMPTVCCLLVYIRNVLMGHPLVIDVGDGSFEVPTLIVFGIILAILR